MKSLRFFSLTLLLATLALVDFNARVYANDSYLPSGISRPESTESGAWMTKKHSMQTSVGEFKFEIHFEEINEVFAKRVLDVLVNDAPKLFDYFRYVPEWTVHFIVDGATHANGSATVFPTSIIHLNNFPPLGMEFLSSEEDWVRGLVVHELAHIIHMDKTTGFFKAIRNVFGSAGKALGSLHPHWFSEGLATWVETEFTHGGRLRSNLLLHTTQERLLDKTFCQEVDCLDEPEHFPYGSFRYWIGAMFLKSLEDKKPGTIRCLFEKNAGRTLFFLNKTFKECTGFPDVARAYQTFRMAQVEAISKKRGQVSRDLYKLKVESFKLPDSEFASDWQRGFEVFNGRLYHVQFKNDERYIVERDHTGQILRSRQFHLPLNQIQTQTKFSRNKGKMIISLRELHGGEQGDADVVRRWISWEPTNDKVEKLDFKHDPLYVFQTDDNNYLTISYEYNRWVARIVKGESEEKLFDLNKLDFLSQPMFDNGILTFKSFSSNRKNGWAWHKLNIQDGDHRIVMQRNRPFEYVMSCGSTEYFRTFDTPSSKKIAGLRREGTLTFLLHPNDPDHGHLFDSKCTDLVKRLKLGDITNKTSKGELFEREDVAEGFNKDDLDNYPNLDQFVPHYWYLQYLAGDNVEIYTVETSVSDPKERHKFYLAGQYFSGVDESSPVASYNYSNKGYVFGTNYGKYYSLSAVQNATESSEGAATYMGYGKTWGYWSWLPLVQYSKIITSDWISKRNVASIRISQELSYKRTFTNDLIQGFNLKYIGTKYDTKRRKDYNGHAARFDMGLKFNQTFYSRLKGTFETLEKSDLSSGVIYGGGHEGIGYQKMHEFYGLSYSSLFGNEIYTGRFQLGAEMLNPYTAGGGLLPFYFKEVHALIGVDVAKSDYTFIDRTFLRNRVIQSYHAGARFDLTLFYNIPASIDLLYAQVQNPVGNNLNEFITVVTGKFVP
ncbi:MAG: hypothetical protein EP326_02680 [Deltaproteobacteria bacterium]|nr:MAG: hypothetical protein EP326_02680 [Deltaproteobacteria bacterium]